MGNTESRQQAASSTQQPTSQSSSQQTAVSIHRAPAGTRYTDVEDAGCKNAAKSCKNFPLSGESEILPNIYLNKYVERLDPVTNQPVPSESAARGLAAKTAATSPSSSTATTSSSSPPLTAAGKYQGLCANLFGEGSERVVYEELHSIVTQKPNPSMLIFHSFDCSKAKLRSLSSQFPLVKADISAFGPNAEFDFIVLVEGVGIIHIEVINTTNGPGPLPLNKKWK